MAEKAEDLVLEHLRVIRAELGGLRDDVRELKTRQSETTRLVIGMRRDQAGDAETVAHVENRLDRFGERLERIERRLDIRDS